MNIVVLQQKLNKQTLPDDQETLWGKTENVEVSAIRSGSCFTVTLYFISFVYSASKYVSLLDAGGRGDGGELLQYFQIIPKQFNKCSLLFPKVK